MPLPSQGFRQAPPNANNIERSVLYLWRYVRELPVFETRRAGSIVTYSADEKGLADSGRTIQELKDEIAIRDWILG
jgi:hypothetical protein